MSDGHKTVHSNSRNPFVNRNIDSKKPTENSKKSIQDQTYAEPNTNPTDKAKKPLKIQDTSFRETFTEQIQIPF